MGILFFSDPHLGLSRSSHTTAASRIKLREAIHAQVEKVLDIAREGECDGIYCLGDWFDTFSNPEQTILDTWPLAQRCDGILSGNHDHSNREGVCSSLQLIDALAAEQERRIVMFNDPALEGYQHLFDSIGDVPVQIVAVPHKWSQTIFEATLDRVITTSVRGPAEIHVLCLHCNYDSGFADQASTLNLTRDRAKQLLKVFDYVLLGHEHQPRSDFEGRLQILGNVFPTSFADISDKFAWELTTEGLRPIPIWDSRHHVSVSWDWLLDPRTVGAVQHSVTPNWQGCQFIEIVGEAPAERMPEIAQAVQRLWSAAPDVLMIRNGVTSAGLQIEQRELSRAMSVPDRITHELQDSPLLPLWQSYLTQLEAPK